MVFSGLFGKKEESKKAKEKSRSGIEPEVKKGASSGAATPMRTTTQPGSKNDAAQRELARATAKKIDQIESEMSLDFMPPRPLPPKAGAKTPAAPAKPSPKEELSPPLAKNKQPTGKAAQGKAETARSATKLHATEQRLEAHTLPPLEASSSIILGDTLGAMALEISASAASPIIEEVAILYANGQGISAINALSTAIKDNQLGPSTTQAWLMLFDLYQLLGKRTEFENLTLEFTQKFESSPPSWDSSIISANAPSATKTIPGHNPGIIVFPETLDLSVNPVIDQIKQAGEKSKQIKVDVSLIRKVDSEGCDSLLKFLGTLKKSGHILLLSGVEQLATLLLANIETGRRDPSDAIWMLLLEMYRALDKETEFEEKSIDYCVTFEVSPPSWEGLPPHLKLSGEKPVIQTQTTSNTLDSSDDFKLQGELLGKAEIELSKLTAHAAEHALVSVNCRALRRVDFAAGSTLLNLLVGLTSEGKKIEFNEVNHLIAALFVVMGIHELALINIKRT